MKKLLTLLGAVGLIATSSATVVSCNDVANLSGYGNQILSNIETEKVVIDNGDGTAKTFDMYTYFTSTGEFTVNGEDRDEHKASGVAMTKDIFDIAIAQAVTSVVPGTKDGNGFTLSNYDMSKDEFDVTITADTNLKLWTGSVEFTFTASAKSEVFN
jgi:hypothetical protein